MGAWSQDAMLSIMASFGAHYKAHLLETAKVVLVLTSLNATIKANQPVERV
jgi:hypothetical protein